MCALEGVCVCDFSQDRQEREMQQLMFDQDEETVELKETYSTLQQEVELKTKKLKKVKLAFNITGHLSHTTKLIFVSWIRRKVNSKMGTVLDTCHVY